jgi:hypothetical protein
VGRDLDGWGIAVKHIMLKAAKDTAQHNQQYHLQQIAVTEICDCEPLTKRVTLNSDAKFWGGFCNFNPTLTF